MSMFCCTDYPELNGQILHNPQPETHRECACQTELTWFDITDMEECNRNMTCELVELKKRVLEGDLTETSFSSNEEKIKFYTGLPNFIAIQHILIICGNSAYSGTVNILTMFQELLLVLMRLRLNMPFEDLGYRFGVSRTTAGR